LTPVWDGAERTISSAVSEAARRAHSAPTFQHRLVTLIGQAAEHGEEAIQNSASETIDALQQASTTVRNEVDKGLSAVREVTAGARSDAARANGQMQDVDVFVERRLTLERRIERSLDEEGTRLLRLAERLRSLTVLNTEGVHELSDVDLAALLDEELLDVRQRADQDAALAQLGMAAETISHELDLTIQDIRHDLQSLRAWSDANPGLRPLHDSLRAAFNHLDGYLALFAPLQRRLYRQRSAIRGTEIEKYLRELFVRRFEADKILLEATNAFRHWRRREFRSTVYPVFINLVDNAIYWVKQAPPPRWIRLDADGDDLLVCDSGRGVSDRDREVIWEFGFTRKPGGRGAGLHIVRQILEREGWRIDLEPRRKGLGARFRISPPRTQEVE
jgi:signal transduction histidine kinase